MSADKPDPTAAGLPAVVALVSGSVLAMLLFASLLVSLRLEKALTELLQDRAELVAWQWVGALEGGLRFGVTLADQSQAHRKMAALAPQDSELLQLALFDDRASPVFQRAQGLGAALPDDRLLRRVLAPTGRPGRHQRGTFWSDALGLHLLVPVRDATGSVSGVVWVRYSAEAPRQAFVTSLRRLAGWSVILAAALGTVFALALRALARRATAALDRVLDRVPAHETHRVSPWPLLPVPQALGTVTALESELEALADARERAVTP